MDRDEGTRTIGGGGKRTKGHRSSAASGRRVSASAVAEASGRRDAHHRWRRQADEGLAHRCRRQARRPEDRREDWRSRLLAANRAKFYNEAQHDEIGDEENKYVFGDGPREPALAASRYPPGGRMELGAGSRRRGTVVRGFRSRKSLRPFPVTGTSRLLPLPKPLQAALRRRSE